MRAVRARPLRPGLSRVVAALGFALAAAIAAGCGSSSSTSTGPSPAKCQVSLTASPASFAAEGGSGTVAVATQPECAWTVSAQPAWMSEPSPKSGQGNGQVTFQAAANPLPAARQGEIAVNDNRVTVRQEAATCVYTIAPTAKSIGAGGDADISVEVAAAAGCAWTASSGASWITVSSGATGSGNGSVHFSAAANAGTVERIGTLTIAGQTFTVAQAAAGCSYTISPAGQSIGPAGGAGTSIAVTATGGCAWTASSGASWITVTSGATGTGNGSVGFTVAANTGAERTGTLTIAGQTFTVTQAAAAAVVCAYTIAPTTQSIGASGGAGTTVTVTTTSNCTWTAVSGVSWITVTSGSTSTGNGSVGFTVAANTGAQRTGTLTIAGQTFTVTQAAAAVVCAYTIAPASQSIGAAGGAGTTVTVTTTSTCTWTAVSSVSWITVTSGATGTGAGSVGFTVSANPGGERVGTLTIAGQTFTVTQAAANVACTYAITPASQSIAAAGGAGTPVAVVVSTPNCSWTAASGVAWITVTSGATGIGNGSVAFTVAANPGTARTGTLTIAGQTFTVTQAAACSYTVSPPTQSVDPLGGTGTPITVTTTAGCSWTASTPASWITIQSGATGSGNGAVKFRVDANLLGDRTATLTVAGQAVTVTQRGLIR